jgi:hypothetical protein
MDLVDRLTSNIATAFANVLHPGAPSMILDGPCCSDHDAVAQWLSRHPWQELAKEIENNDFDPMEFSSISPPAYHYFIAGVLTFVVRNIGRDPDSGSWEGKYWRPLDWVRCAMAPPTGSVHSGSWSDEIRVDRLPLFSMMQREVTKDVLEFVADSDFAARDEIQAAVRQIWLLEP